MFWRRKMQTFLKLGLILGVLTAVWLVVQNENGEGGPIGDLLPDSVLKFVGKYVDLSRLGLKTGARTARDTSKQNENSEDQMRKREDAERKRKEEAKLAEEKRKQKEVKLKEEAKLAEEKRRQEEAKIAEQKRREEEARLAEEKRQEEARLVEEKRQEEARLAEQKRKDEESRLAEQKKKEEAARLAEQRRKEEARLAEQKKREEEARLAEQKRKEEEAKLAEQKKKEEAARLAEQKRKEEEARLAEQKKKEEEARLAEQKRKEEEARLAEQKKKEEEAARLAEQKRKEEEARLAEQRKKDEEARFAERMKKEARFAEQNKKEVEARLAEQKKKEKLDEQARVEEEKRIAEERRQQEEVKLKEAKKKEESILTEQRLKEAEQRKKEEAKIVEQKRKEEQIKQAEQKRREEAKRNEAKIAELKAANEKAAQKRKEEQESAQEQFRKEVQERVKNIKYVNQDKKADDERRSDEVKSAEDEIEAYRERQLSDPTQERPVVHLAVVACGDRQPETMTLLKSARILSKAHLHFHVFAEEELKSAFQKQLDAWPAAVKAQTTFNIYSLSFPRENAAEWKKLFKTCASQRLFLPELLPKHDLMLYVDTDILFLRPPEDVWQFFNRFNSSQIAALAPEHEDANAGWYNRFARHPYYPPLGVNSGVMLMNLKRMRSLGWIGTMIEYLREYKYRITWGDQDLINIFFHFKPEMLYLYPCHWNFRPDHCMYMAVCKPANEKGANIVHGSRRVWFEDKQPAFRTLYQAFEKYTFGQDLEQGLLNPLKASLQKDQGTNCGRQSHILTKQLERQVRLFKKHQNSPKKDNKR